MNKKEMADLILRTILKGEQDAKDLTYRIHKISGLGLIRCRSLIMDIEKMVRIAA